MTQRYRFTILLLAALAFVVSLFFITPATASAACEINSAKFMNYSGQQSEGWYKVNFGRLVHMQITTTDCGGDTIEVSLTENDTLTPDDDLNNSQFDNRQFVVPANGILDIYAWAGDEECEGTGDPDCDYFITVWNDTGSLGGPDYSSYGQPNGNLKYDCDGACEVFGENWQIVENSNADGGRCVISNASFSPSGNQTASNYYSDEQRPLVDINLQTENCEGKVILVNVTEENGPDTDIANLEDKEITVPSGGQVLIKTKAGDDWCNDVENEMDCQYHLRIENPIGKKFSFEGSGTGEINYECDETCNDENWIITYHNGVDENGQAIYNGPSPESGPIIDPDDPCATEDESGVLSLEDDCYSLLAPLGEDFKKVEGITIGGYVNKMVGIIIAVAGVLAVVMLVVGGVQYMTTDALAGKTNARETITKALLGLILALGSYLILRTINPNLLNIEPGIQPVQITADAQGWLQTESQNTDGYELTGTFANPTPSNPAVTSFVNNLQQSNVQLQKIVVQTAGAGSNNNGTAKFIGLDGSEVTINVRFGMNGVAAHTDQAVGDNKTPLGTYALNGDQRPTGGPQEDTPAVTASTNPPVNLGAAYYQIDIALNNQNRGIGFHGHRNNTLGGTNGCIRMKNDDLLLLGPLMNPGTTVEII